MTQDEMHKKDNNLKNNPQVMQKIESFQAEIEKNPRSLCFAQLADLYLTQDLIDEAQTLLERGLQFHPNSVSGMIVLARILKQKHQMSDAEALLTKAIGLAPQNWQAYLMRADLYVRMGKHRLALADFQKVLVYNPTQPVARKAIAKLDMLLTNSIDEVVDDSINENSYSIAPLKNIQSLDSEPNKVEQIAPTPVPVKLERVLSLIDAFIMRQDYAKALKLLYECKSEFGQHSEIEERLLRLSQHETAEKIRPKESQQVSESKKALIIEKKQKALNLLLRRINKLSNERLVHD